MHKTFTPKAFEKNMREPVPMPPIHRKRPPEGTQLVGDIPKCLRQDEPTSDDLAFLWEKYERALVSLKSFSSRYW